MCGGERCNGTDYEVYCLLGCDTAHSSGSLLTLEQISASNFCRSCEFKQDNMIMEVNHRPKRR
jgi:hypothetical protein